MSGIPIPYSLWFRFSEAVAFEKDLGFRTEMLRLNARGMRMAGFLGLVGTVAFVTASALFFEIL